MVVRWRSATVDVVGLEGGVLGLCPASHEDRPRWFALTGDGWLKGLDFDDGSTFFAVRLPCTIEGAASLCASSDGRFVAAVPARGVAGLLYDREVGRFTTLTREDYHADVSDWAVAIVRHAGQDVLVHATAWNRLEAHALPSFAQLAPSASESTVDYFWGRVGLSPSGTRLASFGWYWQPAGGVRVVDVPAWLEGREDPPPGGAAALLFDWWDEQPCWVGEARYALVGCQTDPDDPYIERQEGLVLIDASTGLPERFVPGVVASAMGFDGRHLICLGAQTLALDPATGETVAALEGTAQAWHPYAKVALNLPREGGATARGSLHWLSGDEATPVAEVTPTSLAVLADALEEAGRDDDLARHVREGGPHGARCWAVEWLRAGA
jgi:hypothetical protein